MLKELIGDLRIRMSGNSPITAGSVRATLHASASPKFAVPYLPLWTTRAGRAIGQSGASRRRAASHHLQVDAVPEREELSGSTESGRKEPTMTEIMARVTQAEVEGPAEYFTGHVTIRGQFS